MGKFRKHLHNLKLEFLCLKGLREKYDADVKEHNCWILGTADHRNMGDQAITYATAAYIRHTLPDYNIIEVTEGDIYRRIYHIKKYVGKNDLIILQGGGNLGNVYGYIEDIRRIVIEKIKNIPVIIFPQTVYFTDNDDGHIEIKASQKKYNAHKNLTVFAREYASYNKLKELFTVPVFCVPDIVLSLNQTVDLIQNNKKGSNILLCLRNDREGVLSNEDKAEIELSVTGCGLNFEHTDTISNVNVLPEKREEELKKILEKFASASLVITDRLHGMVFSAITDTPCIVLSNYNHKIYGVYEWIKDFKNIIFLKDKSELTSELVKQYINKSADNTKQWEFLAEKFAPLSAVLLEKSNNGED